MNDDDIFYFNKVTNSVLEMEILDSLMVLIAGEMVLNLVWNYCNELIYIVDFLDYLMIFVLIDLVYYFLDTIDEHENDLSVSRN